MGNEKVEELCISANSNATDSFFSFSSISNAGYQFDREFMNGGSNWNNLFKFNDLSIIRRIEEEISSKRGITFPDYLNNFDTEASCDSMAVMCCWNSDSSKVGEGENGEPLKNTDICYVDIENSALASHTASGFAIFPNDAEGSANCMGFTWKNDEADHSNLYKGNLLFEVAMRYGLKDNGYTRSLPHAPMCACVEQMPVVSHADYKDLEAVHTYFVSVDDTSLLSITQEVDITFNNCGNKGLAEYYREIHTNEGNSNTIVDRITGGCEESESSFLKDRGIMKERSVKWVKVAGKGSYSDPSLSEQLLDGTHSSMTRNEFEELWANSKKILLRRCKYCNQYHQYAYYKRYDEKGLPENVDILHDVKEHWSQYENNTVNVDFNLFPTYDDAVQDKYKWQSVNSNYYNIGFPRDSGPNGYLYNQWNVWDTPSHNKHYGQAHVAFYVAID